MREPPANSLHYNWVVESVLEDAKQCQRLLEGMKKSNEEKAKIGAIMERLVDNIWSKSANFWIT